MTFIHTKWWVCSRLNNTWICRLIAEPFFQLCHAHVRKIPCSPHFFTLQATERCMGRPGNRDKTIAECVTHAHKECVLVSSYSPPFQIWNQQPTHSWIIIIDESHHTEWLESLPVANSYSNTLLHSSCVWLLLGSKCPVEEKKKHLLSTVYSCASIYKWTRGAHALYPPGMYFKVKNWSGFQNCRNWDSSNGYVSISNS